MLPAPDEQSVTAVVTRRIVPGREPDYLAWAYEVEQVAARFPGHQGITYKLQGEDNECHAVFRFDTVEHLLDWEESDERKHWTAKLDGIVEGEARIDRLTGLEFLFQDQLHPKAHKMALVLTAAIFLIVVILNPFFSFLATTMPATPEWLLLLVRVILQVLLLTYLIMPRVMRILAPWLRR
ncbi:MAG TPA: hypothetical protein VIN38_04030 [Thiobacillus sp.]